MSQYTPVGHNIKTTEKFFVTSLYLFLSSFLSVTAGIVLLADHCYQCAVMAMVCCLIGKVVWVDKFVSGCLFQMALVIGQGTVLV